MRLVFAGSGSAFTVGDGNFQSNMVIEADGETGRLLIDCGTDIRHSLAALGLGHRDISTVFISHMHADHIGGLEWLAIATYFDPACCRPKLIIADSIVRQLWENALCAGLGLVDTGAAKLESYFDVCALPEDGHFTWGGTEFTLVPAAHVSHLDIGPGLEMKSHGLLFGPAGRRVYLTTDVQFESDVSRRPYAEADLIFHDCETGPKSGVHSHFSDMTGLPASIKAKTWLYHYQPGPKPDAKAHGFLGFVERGQGFDLD